MKILVTLDGSYFSEAILAPLTKFAQEMGADVELFAVGRLDKVHETPLNYQGRDMVPAGTTTGIRLNLPRLDELLPPPAETRQQAVTRVDAELHDYLLNTAERLHGITATVATDVADDPAEAIIAHARREHVDLIAMATHGRTGFAHLLAGSVCESVIRSGVAPVLVLRPTIESPAK